MATLYDLMYGSFPPELHPLLDQIEATPAAVNALTKVVNAQGAAFDAKVASLEARVAVLEAVQPPDLDTVHVGPFVRVNELTAGWQHTQLGVYPLVVSQQQAIAYASPGQGEHLQGFGTNILWPTEAGPKNWASLDKIYGTPGHPELGIMKDAKIRVLVACGCPAWMKAPKPGTTITQNYPVGDSSTPGGEFDYTPPHRSRYGQYAALVAEACVRYDIDIVVVWNEGKGYWSNTLGRWAYENYTELHNLVASAVHAAKPGCKVGGPYFVLRTLSWIEPGHHSLELRGAWGKADTQALDVLTYFIANQVGADFIAMDVRNSNSDYSQDDRDAPNYPMAQWQTNPEKGVNPNYWPASPSESWAKLEAFMVWLRKRTPLPVWMMEFYANARLNNANPNYPNATPSSVAEMIQQTAEGLIASARCGMAGILQWSPQGDSNGRANPLALYNSAKVNTGLVEVCGQFAEQFPPGAQLYDVVVDNSASVKGLASGTALCLVSRASTSTTLTFKGAPVVLPPFGVKFVAR